MANKVILVGNLGADPEVRAFANGGKVANLSVATAERWKDRNTGEKRERTEWHRVAIMGDGLAGVAERYLRKGSRVYLEGQLRTRKWQDSEGRDRWTTEVVVAGHGGTLELLGDPRAEGAGGGGDHGAGGGAFGRGAGGGATGQGAGGGELDDDIPF